MTPQTEMMLENEKKPEAAAVLQILGEMTKEEQQSLLFFMQGAMYAKEIHMAKIQRGDSDGRS